MPLSRRALARLLFGAALGRLGFPPRARAESALFHVDRLRDGLPPDAILDQSRVYRADAVVSLLSVPIFSRAGVGGGFASFRQGRRGDSTITTASFAGGSFPQRAHHLNRLGFLQEVVVERGGAPVEAAYFGFMTSSPEEGVAEARNSLRQERDALPYVAAEGHLDARAFQSAKTRFWFPARLTWSDRQALLAEVRARFHALAPESASLTCSPGAWPGTILYLIGQAIRGRAAKFEGGYVYNGSRFQLSLEKSQDAQAGAAFAARELTVRPEAVVLLRGVIRKERTGKLTRFRLWIEQDASNPLPLRIELQARSFLALSFEAVPAPASRQETSEI